MSFDDCTTRMSKPNGVVLVDKPAGWTSHDVVAKLRGILKERRIGHAGTLDPMATGLLVIAVGPCTRLLQFATATTKTYTGTVRLGSATDSLDADGDVTATMAVPALSDTHVNDVAATLTGPQMQIPPMVSAIKVDGKKLYELAREGTEIERAPRPVVISSFTLTRANETDWNFVTEVSAGTYVRVLASDLAVALGTLGHLVALRRVASGQAHVDRAWTLDQVAEKGVSVLASPLSLVDHLPMRDVSDDEIVALRQGKRIAAETGEYDTAVATHDGEVVAMLTRKDHLWQPSVVLPPNS